MRLPYPSGCCLSRGKSGPGSFGAQRRCPQAATTDAIGRTWRAPDQPRTTHCALGVVCLARWFRTVDSGSIPAARRLSRASRGGPGFLIDTIGHNLLTNEVGENVEAIKPLAHAA